MNTMPRIPVGRISYNNVLPIFYPLENAILEHPYTFTVGTPSTLNALMRNSTLAISAVSSVEYIKNYKEYTLMEDMAIASHGTVMSVMLFSTVPLEALHQKCIALTEESETSIALLRLILENNIGIQPYYIGRETAHSKNYPYDAMLLIGDSALRERTNINFEYSYDLGELWYEWTSLPFVFAVWAISKKMQDMNVSYYTAPLYKAREWSTQNMTRIYTEAKENTSLTDKEIEQYYSCLCYSLGDKELEGLQCFSNKLNESGILLQHAEFTFAT